MTIDAAGSLSKYTAIRCDWVDDCEGGALKVRAFVGVTDLNWYKQLAAQSLHHDEVNFWFPSSGQGFGALAQGEPFIFKTHTGTRHGRLSNRIVGLGLFSGYARLRISEAWTWLGPANGVTGIEDFRHRISQYRRAPFSAYEDPEIGCVLLNTVTFFAEEDTLGAPGDFAPNIVRGKAYQFDALAPNDSVAEAIARYLSADAALGDPGTARVLSQRTHGEPRMVVPRIGQQAFKALTAEVYHHRCALTGDKVRPVLEAAHILPIAYGGEHRIDNGLLLRSDMHTLFDRGYIGFDPKYQLRVSPALRDQFGNGDWLYAREGEAITVPDRRGDRPNKEFLEWHNDTVFLSMT